MSSYQLGVSSYQLGVSSYQFDQLAGRPARQNTKEMQGLIRFSQDLVSILGDFLSIFAISRK